MARLPLVQLIAGLAVSVGMITTSMIPWAVWPGDPTESPTVTTPGAEIVHGRYYVLLAVLAGTSVLVGAALQSRWPQLVAALASTTALYLAVSVVLALPKALTAVDNGESPAQAHHALGAVLAVLFSALMILISLVGLTHTRQKTRRDSAASDMWSV
jgi:hypothetical protein